jgi:hypothetical protein
MMETFYQQAVHRYKDFTDKQLHQYITRKLTAWCQLYRPKPSSMESVDNENIDGEEGDIVNIPGGDAVNSTNYSMSGGADEERKEESATPAAAAESGGDGAGQPADGGAAVDA